MSLWGSWGIPVGIGAVAFASNRRASSEILILGPVSAAVVLPGQMRRIADFLDIEIDERRFPRMVEHCSFVWMKANATKSTPLGGIIWDEWPLA